MNTAESIVAEYKQNLSLYESATTEAERVLRDALKNQLVHKIESRVKKEASLKKKLQDKKGKYRKKEINDICGLRVITYFSDEIKRIEKIIHTEFDINLAPVEDTSKRLGDKEFGYVSNHYVARFSAKRRALPEYKTNRYGTVKFELQIRSILQHAWAEIEHDRGYKGPSGIPQKVYRRFARLAGLLELCDDEFRQIRDTYDEFIRNQLKLNRRLPIDKLSLEAYVRISLTVGRIDTKAAEVSRLKVIPSDAFIKAFLDRLKYVNMETLGQIEHELQQQQLLVEYFEVEWYQRHGNESAMVPQGVALSFLCMTLVMERSGVSGLIQFLERLRFNPNREPKELAKMLAKCLASAKQRVIEESKLKKEKGGQTVPLLKP